MATLSSCHCQYDQNRQFLKILGDFLSNAAKMYADLLGYFERLHLLSETTVHTFWATFVKIGLLLIPTSGHTG